MKIVMDSQIVLEEIYKLLTDTSYTLFVEIPMDDMAKKLNMSKEYLNLCIHYLIECGFLKGDFAFDKNEKSTKKVIILPQAIDKCERNSL